MTKSNARKNGNKRNKEHSHSMNAETVRQIHELRRSNASGIHLDRRTKRKRTRSNQKSFFLKEDID